jgi:hypothetical protein
VDEDSEPEAEKRSAPPASAPSAAEEDKATLDVQQMVESITEQLTANSVKAGSVATITASDLKLLLSSWEVGAFIVAGEEGGDALQRIVAARAILLQQIERRKRRAKSVQVKEAVSLAQGEISRIQAKITAAKQAKKIDAAVNMSASCKRLQTLIAQANKPGS